MIIYKATNKINGKSYIGQTVKSLKKRIREHINLSKNGSNRPLHAALRKYGPENFTWEIIVDCGDNQHFLNESEIFFIDRYNTKSPNGYNLTDGGEGISGFNHTEETKRKMKKPKSEKARKNMSEAHKGVPLSETQRKSQSIAHTGERNSMYGKHHKPESLEKMSKSHVGIPLSKEHCKSLSEVRKGEKHPMYGKHHTIESRKKMSESALIREERKRNLYKTKGGNYECLY